MKSWQSLSSSSVVTRAAHGLDHVENTGCSRPAARILSCSAGVLMVTFMEVGTLFPMGVHGIKRGYF